MLRYERFRIDVNNEGHIVNTYIVYDDVSRQACIIDPGTATHAKAAKLFQFISKNNLSIQCILLTHCHGDHICGVDIIREVLDVVIAIYYEDSAGYKLDKVACSTYIGVPHPISPIGVLLEDGDVISLGEEELVVIHTPGHTQGSICLYNESSTILFTGDTILSDGHGRTDLPTGSQEAMALSLLRLTHDFPSCIICPGHGHVTSMEKAQKILSKIIDNSNYMEQIRTAAIHQGELEDVEEKK
ncbi:MAG: MBL fold metallo-hydrolase [Clostridia bacterium]